MFQVVPAASCPVTAHHWEQPGSIFSSAPVGYLCKHKIPLKLPQVEKSHLSQSLLILYWLIQLLQVLNCLHGTSLDSCQFVHISFVLGEPRTGPRTPHVSHQCWVQVQDHLPRPAGRPLGCFATSLSCKVPLNGSTTIQLSYVYKHLRIKAL